MWKQVMCKQLQEAFRFWELSELESILIKHWFYTPKISNSPLKDIPF
jgi:hypothetical protein